MSTRELDVHVLVLPDTRQDWQSQALASVRAAAQLADYPVHVHVVPGSREHFGLARGAGYAAGSAPWKTYIDEDDIVLPDAFQVIGRHLEGPEAAILPREYVQQNGVILAKTMRRHHLPVYRTDAIAGFDFGAWRAMTDVAALFQVMTDPRGHKDLMDHIYIHRVYASSNGRRLRTSHAGERGRILEIAQGMRAGGYDV